MYRRHLARTLKTGEPAARKRRRGRGAGQGGLLQRKRRGTAGQEERQEGQEGQVEAPREAHDPTDRRGWIWVPARVIGWPGPGGPRVSRIGGSAGGQAAGASGRRSATGHSQGAQSENHLLSPPATCFRSTKVSLLRESFFGSVFFTILLLWIGKPGYRSPSPRVLRRGRTGTAAVPLPADGTH